MTMATAYTNYRSHKIGRRAVTWLLTVAMVPYCVPAVAFAAADEQPADAAAVAQAGDAEEQGTVEYTTVAEVEEAIAKLAEAKDDDELVEQYDAVTSSLDNLSKSEQKELSEDSKDALEDAATDVQEINSVKVFEEIVENCVILGATEDSDDPTAANARDIVVSAYEGLDDGVKSRLSAPVLKNVILTQDIQNKYAADDEDVDNPSAGNNGETKSVDSEDGKDAQEKSSQDPTASPQEDPTPGPTAAEESRTLAAVEDATEETGVCYTQDYIDEHAGETIEVTGNVTFDNVHIVATKGSAVKVVGEATITIRGDCVFEGAVNYAGIEVLKEDSLVLRGSDAACSVTAYGNGKQDYHSSSEGIQAHWSGGAGIGGIGFGSSAARNDSECPYGESGKIEIDGNNQNMTLSVYGGGRASGIGSTHASTGDITIRDIVFGEIHGGCLDAAVEGDAAYAKGTLEGGAGIGGGAKALETGVVLIERCRGGRIVGGGKAAGIGGACWSDNVHVVIRDCADITVFGGTTGSAIGAGRMEDEKSATVEIISSEINATGGFLGAGIGLGSSTNKDLRPSLVTISGGHVIAHGGAGAAGIGGGSRGYNVSVVIDSGAYVEAYAGANYNADYPERYNSALDLVTGEVIGQSGAAGIGRGAWGSIDFYNKGSKKHFEIVDRPSLTISEDSSVLAMSSGDNWAIAGFLDQQGVEATILQTRFSRNYDLHDKNNTKTVAVDTWAPDLASTARWDACFMDGSGSTVLNYAGAVIQTPAGDEVFRNGYQGNARIGYYSIAKTVSGAGNYAVSTSSNVRNKGDEVTRSGDEGYIGTATHFTNNEKTAYSSEFTCEAGKINSFDQVAFRPVNNIEATGYVGTYDGKSHGISVSGYKDGSTIEYSLDNENWQPAPIEYTDVDLEGANVASHTVYVRARHDDYPIVYANATVTINPRRITIKTGSAERVYDGMALTCGDHTVLDLLPGETISVTPTGSQTEIGSSSNDYNMEWLTAKEVNYTVSDELGTLTVKPVPDTPPVNPTNPTPTPTPTPTPDPPDVPDTPGVPDTPDTPEDPGEEPGDDPTIIDEGEQPDLPSELDIFDDETPLSTADELGINELDIEDDETPLAAASGEQDSNETAAAAEADADDADTVDIEDEDTPLSAAVQTGERNILAGLFTTLAAGIAGCGAAIAAFLRGRRKEQEQE